MKDFSIKVRLKRLAVMTASATIVISFGLNALAKEETAPGAEKPAAYTEKTVTVTAVVQAIDLQNRIVRVKEGPKDRIYDLKVDKNVQNLDRLQIGDRVVVSYIEAIAVRVIKPGEGKAAGFERKVVPEGPGKEVTQTTVTARIQYIDRNTNNVYLAWPDGVTAGVHAKDPRVLDHFKDGDWIEITYTDTLAISIEKTKPQ